MKKPVTIKQNPDAPVATDILAEAIVNVSRGMTKLLKGPLNESAVVILIQETCGGRSAISREDVKRVLHAAADLEHNYVRKPKAR